MSRAAEIAGIIERSVEIGGEGPIKDFDRLMLLLAELVAFAERGENRSVWFLLCRHCLKRIVVDPLNQYDDSIYCTACGGHNLIEEAREAK